LSTLSSLAGGLVLALRRIQTGVAAVVAAVFYLLPGLTSLLVRQSLLLWVAERLVLLVLGRKVPLQVLLAVRQYLVQEVAQAVFITPPVVLVVLVVEVEALAQGAQVLRGKAIAAVLLQAELMLAVAVVALEA
jgi:hypothetical protein